MSPLQPQDVHGQRKMRAWTFTTKGLPNHDTLKLSDVPRLEASSLNPDEVLVKIHYSGIKPLHARAVMHKFPHFTSAPWTPEIDFSGTIEAVGTFVNSQGHRFNVGDEVFGSEDPGKYLKYGGTAREYIIIPSNLAVKKPKNMSLAEAAALGANACTAVLFMNALNLKMGNKVLVTAASGSLGSALIPVLRASVGDTGTIVGVCSTANLDAVRNNGANEVVDYTVVADLAAHLKQHHQDHPFDAIIDIAGTSDAVYYNCPSYLREDGTFLFAGMVNTTHGTGGMLSVLVGVLSIQLKLLTPVFLGGVPRRSMFLRGVIDRNTLETVKEQAENGLLKVNLTKVWEMPHLVEAYEVLLGDAGRGKHVLHVQD